MIWTPLMSAWKYYINTNCLCMLTISACLITWSDATGKQCLWTRSLYREVKHKHSRLTMQNFLSGVNAWMWLSRRNVSYWQVRRQSFEHSFGISALRPHGSMKQLWTAGVLPAANGRLSYKLMIHRRGVMQCQQQSSLLCSTFRLPTPWVPATLPCPADVPGHC